MTREQRQEVCAALFALADRVGITSRLRLFGVRVDNEARHFRYAEEFISSQEIDHGAEIVSWLTGEILELDSAVAAYLRGTATLEPHEFSARFDESGELWKELREHFLVLPV